MPSPITRDDTLDRLPPAKATWKAASFVQRERRKSTVERRESTDRASHGERRKSLASTLRSLLRF